MNRGTRCIESGSEAKQTNMGTPHSLEELWQRRLDRERRAREEAERLLETKSRELYLVKQGLEETVRARTEELERALGRAERAMEQNSHFLATVSHEIRTPMNGVVGMLEMLASTSLTPEQRDMVRTVQRCSDDLLALLNDLLDLSRLEAGRLELDLNEMAIADVARHVAALMGPLAIQKGIGFSVEIDPDIPRVRADALRLRQIYTNLLSNAIKFTEVGEVRMAARVQNEDETGVQIELSVSDTGVGMGPEVQARLFEAFQQGDVSTTSRYGGSGLGMAIVQSLVDLMEGSIRVESAPGAGTTVVVELWLDRAEAIVPHAPAGMIPVSGSEPPVNGGASLSGRRVLVVDDTPVNQQVAAHLLRSLGCEPVLADDGVHALDVLTEHRVDAVLTDLNMPRMDGEQLADELRNRQPGLPVLMMSAGKGLERAIPVGLFHAQVPKPVTKGELYRVLVGVFSGSE